MDREEEGVQRGANEEEEERGVSGEDEEGGSPGGGRSKVSVELHSEWEESREEEEEGGGSTTCPSLPPPPCSPPSSSGERSSCVSAATLPAQEDGGVGGETVTEGVAGVVGGVGFGERRGLSGGLGGDKRVFCLGGGEEEHGAWLSSVRYLWGLRRILGGSGA